MISFLAFAIPLTIYVSFPSTLWNFDGVACAAALELGRPAYFFHADHLLYGFLGFGFWNFIGLPLGLSRALPALQLMNSLLAAAGLIGVYRVALPIVKNQWSALLLTLALSVSAAFWVWSIEAQVYPLGFLPLAWATAVLLHEPGRNKYWIVGILHGAAVLGHLMHFLWAIPALYWIYTEAQLHYLSTRRGIGHYLGALALTTIVPYLAVLTFVISPGRNLNRVLIWLKGSAGLTPDRSWAWHFPGWKGPWVWLTSTAPVFWGSFWPYGKTIVTPALWILTGISVFLAGLLLLQGLPQRSEKMARFSWIWIGAYGLFLSTWEPATYCYRMTDILPFGILLALGLRTWKFSGQLILVSLLLASTLILNLLTRTGPMHESGENVVYQNVLNLSKTTPPNSLYITTGGLPWMYLLYFTGRSAWNANALDPKRLAAQIAREKKRRPVYIQRDLSWTPAA